MCAESLGTTLPRAYLHTMIGSALTTLAGVASGILAARLLGPEGRGELAMLTMVPALTTHLGNLNLVQAVAHLANPARRPLPALGASSLAAAALLGAIQCICIAPLLPLLVPRLPELDRPVALVLMGLVPVTYAIYVLLGMDLGAGRLLSYSLYQALPPVLYVLFLVLIAVAGRCSAVAFALANLTAWTAVAAIRTPQLIRLAVQGAPAWPSVAEVFRCGATFGLSELAAVVLLRVDYPILARMVKLEDLGLYAVALAIAGGQAAIATPVSQVCFRLASGAQARSGPLMVARQFRLFQLIFLVIALVDIALAPLVIRIAFGGGFLPATRTARWLIAAMAFWSSSYLLENGMRGLGTSMVGIRANVAALVLVVACSPWLVARRGIMGMGQAMCFGQAASLVLKVVLLARRTALAYRDFWGLNRETAAELVRAAWNWVAYGGPGIELRAAPEGVAGQQRQSCTG